MPKARFISNSKTILKAAAIYNILWGSFIVFFPNLVFNWAGLPQPNYPQIWQAVGMIVGVYGLGYWWSAANPVAHWPVVAVGYLGKLFGIVGGIFYTLAGQLDAMFLVINLFNDIIWVPFFTYVLYGAFKAKQDVYAKVNKPILWQQAKTTDGQELGLLSKEKPLLLIFVRHFGCSFCKETLKQVAQNLTGLRQQGAEPVIVHMSCGVPAAKVLNGYGLGSVKHVSDTNAQIYESMNLQRARLGQVFGYQEWVRGVYLLLFKGISAGKLQGDGFRLPGAFLVYNGLIQKAYRSTRASQAIPMQQLAQQAGSCIIEA